MTTLSLGLAFGLARAKKERAELLSEMDRRSSELLASNNALLERAMAAEAERTRYLGLINAALTVLESPGSGARSLMEVYMILNQVRHDVAKTNA